MIFNDFTNFNFFLKAMECMRSHTDYRVWLHSLHIFCSKHWSIELSRKSVKVTLAWIIDVFFAREQTKTMLICFSCADSVTTYSQYMWTNFVAKVLKQWNLVTAGSHHFKEVFKAIKTNFLRKIQVGHLHWLTYQIAAWCMGRGRFIGPSSWARFKVISGLCSSLVNWSDELLGNFSPYSFTG